MSNENPEVQEAPHLDDRDRIHVLLEEYQALYGLLRFRLDAMDQRLPLAGGIFIAVLGSISSMPSETQRVLLLALPASIVWLGRMTIAHARSKEDIKRRIDELEQRVNAIAGEVLLAFQSRHPDRLRHVAGRTGMGTVHAVVTLCLLMLASCGYLFGRTAAPRTSILAYEAFVVGTGLYLLFLAWSLRRYPGRTSPPAAERALPTNKKSR